MVFDMTPECDAAADIGCDHALLSIALYMSGRAKRVIAGDVREGPLSAARRNIDAYGCADGVLTVLSFGLRGAMKYSPDAIIIAGMGGETIASILEEYADRFSGSETFVLQPQSSAEDLRRYLYGRGFEITSERLCIDGGHLYIAMSAKFTGRKEAPEEVFYYIGRELVKGRDPLAGEFIKRRIREHEKILAGLGGSGGLRAAGRGGAAGRAAAGAALGGAAGRAAVVRGARARARIRRTRIAAGVSAAAGKEGNEHENGQDQSDGLFHVLYPPVSFRHYSQFCKMPLA